MSPIELLSCYLDKLNWLSLYEIRERVIRYIISSSTIDSDRFFTCYFGYTIMQMVHSGTYMVDHDHELTCSPEIESDPCHRRLVHYEDLPCCRHQRHLTNQEDDCDLCWLFLSKVQQILPEQVEQVDDTKLYPSGPIGGFGGALYKIDENKFMYSVAPSVLIQIEINDDVVKSLTLTEPGLMVVAIKV